MKPDTNYLRTVALGESGICVACQGRMRKGTRVLMAEGPGSTVAHANLQTCVRQMRRRGERLWR